MYPIAIPSRSSSFSFSRGRKCGFCETNSKTSIDSKTPHKGDVLINGTEDEVSNSILASVQIDFTRLLNPTVLQESIFSSCLDKTNSSLCRGTEDSDDLTIVQIDHTQLLILAVEEHQTISSSLKRFNPPSAEANKDKKLLLNVAITLRDQSLKNLNHLQSLNEVMSTFSSEARGNVRALQSSVDVMTSMNSCPMEQDARPPLKNQSSQFIKKSPLWGVFESMEVLKSVPQNPHFRPLEKEYEEFREGIAIGHMVNFANLMERTCKVHIDDPRSKFETKLLQALPSYEELGFTVEPIRSRLEELVKIKDSFHRFGDSLKTTNETINNARHQSDETHESITRLNMELQALLIEKERLISEVAELQMTAEEIDGMLEGTRLDFYGLVTAPW